MALDCSCLFGIMTHNLTHCFYLSLIHLLFANSFSCLSHNLLDVLPTIKRVSIVHVYMESWCQVGILSFYYDCLSLLKLFWQPLLTIWSHLVSDKQWSLLASSTSSVKTYVPTLNYPFYLEEVVLQATVE